jgi:hypothetical protein
VLETLFTCCEACFKAEGGSVLAVLTQYDFCPIITNEVLLMQSQFIMDGKPLHFSLYNHTVH